MYSLKQAIARASEKNNNVLISQDDLSLGGSLQGGLGFPSDDRTIKLLNGKWIVERQYSETFVNEETGRTITKEKDSCKREYSDEEFLAYFLSGELTLTEYKQVIDYLSKN